MRLHNYWWVLIWIFLIGGISAFFNVKQREIVLGRVVIRWKWFFALVLGAPYVVWAAWRPDSFGDTALYRETFVRMPTGLSHMLSFLATRPKGKGFSVFEYLFKSFISHSDKAFFFAIALIQIYCVVRAYRKYSRDFWLSMFLFIASTDYLLWMYNGIRQFLAVTIVFTCLPLLAQKKYLYMCVVIILAALIHSTALIYFPFLLVVNGRAWNKRTILFILGVTVAVFFVDQLSGIIIQTMEGTVYEGDISTFLNDDGTNILRVLFYAIPTVMAWIFRAYIDRADDPIIHLFVNLSIISTGIYVFSFFTSGILIGAIPIYFSLGNYVLIPWLLSEVFDERIYNLFEVIFIGVYSFFFYFQCGPGWKIL